MAPRIGGTGGDRPEVCSTSSHVRMYSRTAPVSASSSRNARSPTSNQFKTDRFNWPASPALPDEDILHDDYGRQQRRLHKLRRRESRTNRQDVKILPGSQMTAYPRKSRHRSFSVDMDSRYAEISPSYPLAERSFGYARPQFESQHHGGLPWDYSADQYYDSSDCSSVSSRSEPFEPLDERVPRFHDSAQYRSLAPPSRKRRRKEENSQRCRPDSKRSNHAFTRHASVGHPSGRTVLHLASCFGHVAVLKLLLAAQPRPELHARDELGQTALHLAAADGHVEIVEVLLEAVSVPGPASMSSIVNAKDNGGMSALQLSSGAGHEAVVKILLDKGAVLY